MLVLSRHKGEQIQIGENITLTVVEIRGDKVRLGVEAPGEVPVHRMEVYDAIKRQQQGEEQSKDGEGNEKQFKPLGREPKPKLPNG